MLSSPPAPSVRPAGAGVGLKKYAFWLVTGGLGLLTLATWSFVLRLPYVNYDDQVYLLDNPHVRRGFTWDSLRWSLTTFYFCNWHPLVWWSFLLDTQLYGLGRPGGFHATNLLWHLGSVIVLFAALRRLTGQLWPSALVAAVFAVHPINVTTVAWISERKGLISTFFFMLMLLAYAWYVEKPGLWRYLSVVACLTLGLMAKQMLITAPAVLLLLDYWPLRRTPFLPPDPSDGRMPVPPGRLLLEKLPLLVPVGLALFLGMRAQIGGNAAMSLRDFSVSERIGHAFVSYVAYLRRLFWPTDLGLFHELSVDPDPTWQVTLSVLFLLGVTAVATVNLRARPYLAVGWFWFLGTLFPVIGLLQLGSAAQADRYAYIPALGIYIATVWGLNEIAVRVPRLAYGLGFAATLVLAGVTWTYLQPWHDNVVLWESTLRVAGEAAISRYSLGCALAMAGKKEEALRQYEMAVKRAPWHEQSQNAIGAAYLDRKDFQGAIAHFEPLISKMYDNSETRYLLGTAYKNTGQLEKAVEQWQEGLPYTKSEELGKVRNELGLALLALHRLPEAREQFQLALADDPDSAALQFHLGLVAETEENWNEAVERFQKAVERQPKRAHYHRELGYALWSSKQQTAAAAEYEESLRLDPRWPEHVQRAAWLLATSPNPRVRSGRQALQLAQQLWQARGASDGADARVFEVLAAAQAELGNYSTAAATERQALRRAEAEGQTAQLAAMHERLQVYESGRPYRMPPPQSPPTR